MKKHSKNILVAVVAVVILLLVFAVWNKRSDNQDRVAEDGQASISRSVSKSLGRTVSSVLRFDGKRRTYSVHAPSSYDGKSAVPLVIVLHGGGDDAETVEGMSGFSQKAEEEGFVVAYPNGTGWIKTWNAGFCCGDTTIDDVGFISALIDELSSQYEIDPSRVFVTGVSNGGFLAYRVGAELSEKVAAIAPIAASLGDYQAPANAVSVIAFHGKKDRNVPYNGGVGIKSVSRADNKSVAESIGFWVSADGCSSQPKVTEVSDGISLTTYSACRGGSEVELYTIEQGGHAWPSESSEGISATDVMWDFFEGVK